MVQGAESSSLGYRVHHGGCCIAQSTLRYNRWVAMRQLQTELFVLCPSGVDWAAVHKYVDVSKKLDTFANPHQRRPQFRLGAARQRLARICRSCFQCLHGKRRRSTGALPFTHRPSQGDLELGATDSKCVSVSNLALFVRST